jgi:hypothetical protein
MELPTVCYFSPRPWVKWHTFILLMNLVFFLLLSLASIVQFWTFASSYFFWFPNLFRHTAGLLGQVISSLQGLYLHRTTQHRNTSTNIHALSGIRTRDPVYERSRPTSQTSLPLDRQWTSIIFTNKGYGTCNFIMINNILGTEELNRKQSNVTIKVAPSY